MIVTFGVEPFEFVTDTLGINLFEFEIMVTFGVVPEAVQLVLDRFRVVGLRQFAHRSISFNFFTKIKTARRPKQDEACSVVPPEFAAKSRALVNP